MKDLSNLINNYKPLVNHEEKVVIDEFAKNIIDRVFGNLATIFPAWKHNWKSDDPSDPDKVLRSAKREWTKAFVENNITTLDQIKFGFAKARRSESDFLPSPGKFISWCKPSPEDLGYPSEHAALTKCVSHRNKTKMGIDSYESNFIIELVKQVDWWLMNQATDFASQKKADIHFKETYLSLSVSYKEPLESESARLETSNIVKGRMSEQQLEDGRKRGLDALKGIKSKLKRKPNDVL